MVLGRRFLFESTLVAVLAFGADLATTLYGLSLGLQEENPLAQALGFPTFVLVSFMIQLAATVAVSATWMSFNGHWRAGYVVCSLPRILIALMNLQKVFFL